MQSYDVTYSRLKRECFDDSGSLADRTLIFASDVLRRGLPGTELHQQCNQLYKMTAFCMHMCILYNAAGTFLVIHERV